MKKVSYVFEKADMESYSDAVLHSTIDVEWKEMSDNVSVLIHCDDVPLFILTKKGGRPSNGLTHDRTVTLLEDPSQEFVFSWKECAAKSPTALLEWFSHIQTAGPVDTVELVKCVGSLVERELNELGCVPAAYWNSRGKRVDM
jgi:hypothetical protein